MFEHLAHLGSNVSLLHKDEHCTVYRVQDSTGEGQMTCYPVFPGIVLNYNDFHLEQCISEFQAVSNIVCINHCREGRIEWEFKKNRFIYLEAGDMQISNQYNATSYFSFPLCHYHGVTVGIFPDEATGFLEDFSREYGMDLSQFLKHMVFCEEPFIMQARSGMEHIFSDLYNVPEELRAGYHKIKVLELLLFLCSLDITQHSNDHLYFHRTQVDTIKKIKGFLEENLREHYTLADLSGRFSIGLTSMKQCFKAVYGVSIYSYMRAYRMNAAAVLLHHNRESISDIAALMGYENASKFSAAFKDVIGLSPSEYRKSAV